MVRTVDELVGGLSHRSLDSGRVDSRAVAPGTLSFSDIAVLYRTDAQSGPIVEALSRAGVPVQKRSHNRLRDRAGVQVIARELRHADGLGGSLAARVKLTAQVLAQRYAAPTLDAEQLAPDDIWAAADLLMPLAHRIGDDLPRFLQEIATGAEVDALDPRAEAVNLLTLHAAKGLEFPVVFLVGCEDGLLPLRWPGSTPADDEVAEERRLFFVGLTRAQDRLYVTHAARRFRHGSEREQSPTPFLDAIDVGPVRAAGRHRAGPPEGPPAPPALGHWSTSRRRSGRRPAAPGRTAARCAGPARRREQQEQRDRPVDQVRHDTPSSDRRPAGEAEHEAEHGGQLHVAEARGRRPAAWPRRGSRARPAPPRPAPARRRRRPGPRPVSGSPTSSSASVPTSRSGSRRQRRSISASRVASTTATSSTGRIGAARRRRRAAAAAAPHRARRATAAGRTGTPLRRVPSRIRPRATAGQQAELAGCRTARPAGRRRGARSRRGAAEIADTAVEAIMSRDRSDIGGCRVGLLATCG